MSDISLQKVKQIFNWAVDLEPAERERYITEACGGDADLRCQVENLLNSYDTDFLESSTKTDSPKRTRLTSGDTIGRYWIVDLLGVGGMGEVYLAHDAGLDRNVAIKMFSSGDNNLERFVREAQSASALNHPHICTIYEIDQKHDPPFIAMEYIEGETLADLIHSGKLPMARVVDLALQIADGLAEAHEAGIIHRDIKPANIIVNKRGQPKILDFGLAKRILAGLDDKTQQKLSVPGMIMGTVSYMSPEQVRGKEIDARSDIFSFGVLLYEMIAGRRPFGGESAAETMSLILTAEPEPLTQIAPALLQGIVRKCLEKDPNRRYGSISDVIGDLNDLDREYSDESSLRQVEEPTVRIVPELTAKPSVIAKGKRMVALWIIGGLAVVIVAAGTGYFLFMRNPQAATKGAVASSRSPAYDLYVRGKVKVAAVNLEDNSAAINLLEQAVAIDPNYAEAWAALAEAYNVRSFYFAPVSEQKTLDENAAVAVEKAMELNPDLAEAHFARGFLLWTHGNRFPHEQAIQAYKRAIDLDPGFDEPHHWLGVVYLHIGLLDNAWDETQKALALKPDNTRGRFRFGVIDVYLGKYEDALAVFKTVPADTNPEDIYRQKAAALFALGRFSEAQAVVDQFLKDYPSDLGGCVTSINAMLLAKAGKQREAEQAIRHAIDIGQGFGHFHHTAYYIASAYAIMNKPDEAITWLQNAADDGFPCYPYFEIDHNLDNIRGDPRFVEFMRKGKAEVERFRQIAMAD